MTEQTKAKVCIAPPVEAITDDEDSDVLLDVSAGGLEGSASGLKLAADGRTVLIPQPTEDPNDPVNWSWTKKHMILFIVSFCAFLGDFVSAAGIPCVELQGVEWDRSPARVNYATNLNVVMLGIGGVLFIPLSYIWGRAPVLFWSFLIVTFVVLGIALAPDFATFYGLRAVQGLMLSSGQMVGLAYIQDMFFIHEHARKIGIWESCLIVSPYVSPLLGNFIIGGTGHWRPVFWLCFSLCTATMILMVLFLDESFYDRSISTEKQLSRGSSRLLRVLGVWQIRNRTYFWPVWRACGRVWKTLLQPTMIPIMIFYCMNFMWAIGVNITVGILLATPVADGGYGFGATSTGYMYFAPLVGIAIGEGFGHFFNDFITAWHVRRHKGRYAPEARIWTNYIAAVVTIPGLVLLGQAFAKHLTPAAIAIGWGMQVVGLLMVSVATTAYGLDSYPNASSEVGGLINLGRTIGGFTVGYFQAPWGEAEGYGASFGIQAAVVAGAAGVMGVLHVYGKGWRARAKKPLVF